MQWRKDDDDERGGTMKINDRVGAKNIKQRKRKFVQPLINKDERAMNEDERAMGARIKMSATAQR